jgi:hypothetical protein
VNLDNYPNKEAIWGNDEITKIIQGRVSDMPDLPKQVAIILSWSDAEDESIKQAFGDTGAIYDLLALKWLGKPFRLFFLSCSLQHFILGVFLTSARHGTAANDKTGEPRRGPA